MRIGVISDTHGFLDPRIKTLFKGVNWILHGGDIGPTTIVRSLECIAPVTAVLGNTDSGIDFQETEMVLFENKKFLIHHIVDVTEPAEKIRERIKREMPDVVVFGHTHKPYSAVSGKTLYFNPGYAGKPRFNLPRSVGLLHCEAGCIRSEFLEL